VAMEYYSFDRVLSELAMGEGELKRLVSEGEIRAFRDEDKMKFKKSDIEGLKKGRMTEPTIILPSGGGDDESELDDESSEVLLVEDDTSETLLDIDELDDDDFESGSSTSVPTVDFSVDSDETGSETLTEELIFDDDSSSAFETEDIASQATFVDDDTGMTTEPIELIDDDDDDSETMVAPSPQRGARRGAMPVAEAPGNPVMSAVLVFSALVLLFGGFLVISLIQEEDNAMTGWLTDLTAGIFPITTFDDEGKPHTPKSDREIKEYKEWRAKNRQGKVNLQIVGPAESSDEDDEPTGGTH